MTRATRRHFQPFTSGYSESRVCTTQQPNKLGVQECIPKIIFICKLKKMQCQSSLEVCNHETKYFCLKRYKGKESISKISHFLRPNFLSISTAVLKEKSKKKYDVHNYNAYIIKIQ